MLIPSPGSSIADPPPLRPELCGTEAEASQSRKFAPPRMPAELKRRLDRLARERAPKATTAISLGIPAIDRHLPAGGLAQGALHEVAGSGPETEHAAAAALFCAGVLAWSTGSVLWALEQPDLFAPALAGVGLSPDRIIFVEAGRSVLLVMEEALRQSGLAGVVGEISGRVSLTASRRLHLAAEGSGVPGLLLRRSRTFNDPVLAQPNAALTRWRIAAQPAGPPLPHAPEVPGLGQAIWRLTLVRCRGGESGAWTVRACDAQGRLGLVSDLPHRSAGADAADLGRRLRTRRMQAGRF